MLMKGKVNNPVIAWGERLCRQGLAQYRPHCVAGRLPEVDPISDETKPPCQNDFDWTGRKRFRPCRSESRAEVCLQTIRPRIFTISEMAPTSAYRLHA